MGLCFGKEAYFFMSKEWIMPIYSERHSHGTLIAAVLFAVVMITMTFFYFTYQDDRVETTTKWDGPPQQFMTYTQTKKKGYEPVSRETNLTIPKASTSAVPDEKDLQKEVFGWFS